MKIAFDTSVIVAALFESHPHNAAAAIWRDLVDAGDVSMVWTTHAYAETWSVLTRLPLAERIAPEDAGRVVDSLAHLSAPVDLTLDDYRGAADRAAAAGGRSGIIFDALHLVAAERDSADALFTLNVADFVRLSPQLVVDVPPDDPEEFAARHGFE